MSTPSTRRSKGPRQHRIFLPPLSQRTLNGSSISLSGNLHPQQLSWDPLFTLGRSDFAPSRIQWSSVGLLNPQNPIAVNAELSFFLSGFSLSQFWRFRCRGTCLSDSRIPIFRNSDTCASLTFQRYFTSSTFHSSQYHES
jgi:hypothetical protein